MTDLIDVVIPVRNEEDTIRWVIACFATNPLIGNVIVVCNQCTDNTWMKAQGLEALVLRQDAEAGKGQSLKVGLDYVETERVIFCDGDLSGHLDEYVDRLAAPGYPGMVVGVPDFPALSPVPWPVPGRVFALVAGQRSLPTDLARGLDLHGYCAEVQINQAVQEAGLPVEYIYLRGVTGKIRQNSRRMAELRRDQQWLRENWK